MFVEKYILYIFTQIIYNIVGKFFKSYGIKHLISTIKKTSYKMLADCTSDNILKLVSCFKIFVPILNVLNADKVSKY